MFTFIISFCSRLVLVRQGAERHKYLNFSSNRKFSYFNMQIVFAENEKDEKNSFPAKDLQLF